MSFTYNYLLNQFSNGFNQSQFHGEIIDAIPSPTLLAVNGSGNNISVVFTSATPDVTSTLNSLVLAHLPKFPVLSKTIADTSIVDATSYFQNDVDDSKQFRFDLSDITPGTTRVLEVPDANTMLVGADTAQTLTNKTLSDATTWFQDDMDSTKKMQFELGNVASGATRVLSVPDVSDTLVGLSATQTLTNKTLTTPIISNISNAGLLTLPTTTDTLVGRATTDTLTNKTLTSPIISTISNTGTLTLPTTTDTLVGRATTDTLTNKTLIDSSTRFADEGDNTKKMQFQLSAITPSTTRTLTVPDTSDILVTLAYPQTLTNKTFASPVMSNITNGGTLTLPTSTDTLVARNTTDTLTNKTLVDATTWFEDEADNTKKLQLQLNAISTSTTRTLQVPDADTVIVGTDTVQTLTNKTLTTPIISNISNTGLLTLPTSTDTLVGRATTDTLTNKTLTDSATWFQDESDNTKKVQLQLSGITTGTTRTLTVPNTSDTLVTLDFAQTLTNKTLTSPVISTISNSGNLTLPTSTDTLVGRVTTDTLTNKTFTDNVTWFQDDSDNTKRLQFQLSNITSNTTRTLTIPDASDTIAVLNATQTLTNKTLTVPVISSISNTGLLTLPTSTDTLIGRNTVDSLTNKTLVSPIISSISNTGNLTLPTTTDTLVGRTTTDTLTNKTFTDNVTWFQDDIDDTKKMQFDLSPISASTTRTLTVPNISDTLVTLNAAQTLTNKTLNSPIITTIINSGALTLPATIDTLVGRATVDTLKNKTLVDATTWFEDESDNTKKLQLELSGISPNTTRTLTIPDISDAIVTLSALQTLTNKTLTSPIINTPVISNISNGGTLTLPTSTDTLVGRSTVDTLTNKTLVDAATWFEDESDNTKKLQLQLSGISPNTTRILTVPNTSDTFVTLAFPQTLLNKTLTDPIISNISNGGTLTLPNSTDTLVGRVTVDTLTNKTLVDATTWFEDELDNTKKLQLQLSGISTGNTRILNVPDVSDTLVVLGANQTLTNKTLTAPVISTIVNTGTLTLPTTTDTIVGRSTTDTLTNKTLTDSTTYFQDESDNTKKLQFQLSGISPSTTRTLTVPDSTDTIVVLAANQTLTNKTLTTPIISNISNGGILTLPTSTDTLVGRNTVDTLTNKTLTLPVISSISNGGTLTLPTTTDTLVGRNTVDTLTNKTLVDTYIQGDLSVNGDLEIHNLIVNNIQANALNVVLNTHLQGNLSVTGTSIFNNQMTVNANVAINNNLTTSTLDVIGTTQFSGNVVGLTKSYVGLSQVDNTSDLSKPISTATQSALNLKQDKAVMDAIFNDTKEPTGFINRTSSTLSWNDATRTLSVAPVSTSFDIYVKGTKITISTTLTKQIPDVSGTYFFIIDNLGVLSYLASFNPTILTDYAYTSFVYWNSTFAKAITFGEERHGITMDGATHSYLHTSRGTQLLSGGSISYTVGDGSSDTHAEISIGDCRVADEDITVNITNSASPTNPFEQKLNPIAYIPVYYQSGSHWTKDVSTTYPMKQGTTRAQYNLFSGGTWSTVDASADGKFLASFIFATTDIIEPIIAIIGQTEYPDLSTAQANASWSNIVFNQLPAQEMKLLHIIIYETDSAFANTPKAAVQAVKDVRFGADREVSALSLNTAHSNLSGLLNDDHPQYHNDVRGDTRYYTKTQVDANYYTQTQSDARYYTQTQSDARYYTQTQIDNNFYTQTQSDARYYTQTQIDNNFYTQSHINANYYTQTQSDARYYTQTQIDNNFYTKTQSNARYYTQTQIDTNFYTQTQIDTNFYTKTQSDANYYTKTQSDANYYTKTYIDGEHYINQLTGDITATGPIGGGSTVATLANSGVSIGTYNTVTVDTKGRVTAGSNTTNITSLNLLTDATQTFATGLSGTDFNISSASSVHTFNIPSASASARGLVTTGTQTFAGVKTFSSAPVISSITNAGTLTLPTTTDTLVGRVTTDTLENKTLIDSKTWFQDDTDSTKKLQLQLSGIATGTTRTLTIPDTSDTLVTLTYPQTLTNKTLTSPIISTISNTGTITLPTSTDTLVGRATSDTLTNKTLVDATTWFQDDIDSTKKLQLQLSGITTGTTRTLTVPNTTDTIAVLNFAQTLSNKTLITPIISNISNTGLLTLPTSTDTLIGRATTDTLTNKTIIGSTNTIAASQLRTATSDVIISGAISPSTGQVLTATSATTANWQTPTAAISSLNTLTAASQTFATGNTGSDFTIVSSGTTHTFNIPNASATARGLITTGAQTLAGTKTFSSAPVISAITNTGTLTLPTTTDTLVGRTTTDTLTNKTLVDSTTWFQDDADNTKKLQFQLSNITTGTTRTLSVPNISDTLVTLNAVQTLTNKTLTAPNIITPIITTPVISNISNTGLLTLPTSTDTLVGRATTDTLTNKTLVDATTWFQDDVDNTKKLQFQLSGITTGTTRTLTVPNTSDTIVTLNLAQPLTNKTLITPIITTPIISNISNTGLLTLPTSTDTIIGRATTDTLTNKTITGTTNTVAASQLRTATSDVIISAATAPSTGQVLTATSATTANWQTPSSTGIASLNTLTSSTQTFATGNAGTDFVITSLGSTHTFNIPSASAVSRGLVSTVAQTFAGVKTFSSAPVISTITNTGTLTLPTSTDTLVGLITTDTLQNKSLVDASTYFIDNVDATKRMQFEVNNIPTATTRTFTSPNTTTNCQLLCVTSTDSLVNKTIVGSTNTVAASQLRTTTSDVIVSGATAPSTGQVLTATSATTANWQTPVTTSTPAGADKQIQYNKNGVLAGDASFTWFDGASDKFLAIGTQPANLQGLAFSIIKSRNNWIQNIIQNTSSGVQATTDIVLMNNLGTDTNYFINLGMNSSGYSDPSYPFSSANDGYLYVMDGHLTVGTETTGTDLILHSGGWNTTNIGLRLASTNKVAEFSYLVRLSNGTTATRPSLPSNGMIWYNNTTNLFEYYENGAWKNIVDTVTAQNLTNKTVSGPSLNLTDVIGGAPAAPANGSTIFTRTRAGRRMLAQIGSTGLDYSFQPTLFAQKASLFTVPGNSTIVHTWGFNNTASGTATARNVATTNIFTSMRRIGFVSAATAGSSAGTRHGAQQFFMSTNLNFGGFFYVARFGLSSATTVATQRTFVGLIASTTVLSNADPSTQLNILGFGVDSGDTTWTFMHNDGTGTATKDVLTGTFPPRDSSVTMFEARIYCPPNSTTVSYSLEVLGGSSLFEGSTSTDIPAVGTLLSPQIWTNNGTTATACAIDVASQYIETEN